MDYPILMCADGKDEIVTPEKFALQMPSAFKEAKNIKKKGIHRAYIIFYDDPHTSEFLKKLKVVFQFHSGSITTLVFEYKKSLIAISPLGGPAAAGLMEELSVFGIDEFVAIGSAGCLDESVKNKFVLVKKAIRDEGTSYHYLRPSTYVETNKELSGQIEEFLLSKGLAPQKAVSWTTDALYRETQKKVEMAKKLGAVAVEMECASWCAVAKYRGFKFAQILYFSDVVKSEGWERYLELTGNYVSEKRDAILSLVKDMADTL